MSRYFARLYALWELSQEEIGKFNNPKTANPTNAGKITSKLERDA
jgi:hypothetical protein